MSSFQAILLAICVWCGSSSPASAKEVVELQCYASELAAKAEHPGEHLRHKRLPDGMCWHTGHWREGISIATKHSHPKTGSVQSSVSSTPKKIHPHDDWSTAKAVPYYHKLLVPGLFMHDMFNPDIKASSKMRMFDDR